MAGIVSVNLVTPYVVAGVVGDCVDSAYGQTATGSYVAVTGLQAAGAGQVARVIVTGTAGSDDVQVKRVGSDAADVGAAYVIAGGGTLDVLLKSGEVLHIKTAS